MNLTQKTPCVYCGRKALLSVPGCNALQYFSKDCQKKHWPAVKQKYKAFRKGEDVKWPEQCLALRVKESIDNLDFDALKSHIQKEKFVINDFITLSFQNAGTMSCPNLTPLNYAISQLALEKNKENHDKIVKFCKRIVYELNPDIEKQSMPTGYTALATATAAKSFPMMEILAKKGANVNAKDIISGGTFLNQFVTGISIKSDTEDKWNLQTIPKLKSWIETYKFNPNIKDYREQTPYSLGRKNKLIETCKLLKSELNCEDVEDNKGSDEQEKLRDAIRKVEAGELSIKDLGLNLAEYKEAKRLANYA